MKEVDDRFNKGGERCYTKRRKGWKGVERSDGGLQGSKKVVKGVNGDTKRRRGWKEQRLNEGG